MYIIAEPGAEGTYIFLRENSFRKPIDEVIRDLMVEGFMSKVLEPQEMIDAALWEEQTWERVVKPRMILEGCNAAARNTIQKKTKKLATRLRMLATKRGRQMAGGGQCASAGLPHPAVSSWVGIGGGPSK